MGVSVVVLHVSPRQNVSTNGLNIRCVPYTFPPGRSDRRTGRDNQFIGNENLVFGSETHRPLVSIPEEDGPELRGGLLAAMWYFLCKVSV